MHRERIVSLATTSIILDVVIVLFSFFFAFYSRYYLSVDSHAPVAPSDYGWFFLTFLFFLIGSNYLHGFYTFGRTITRGEIFTQTIQSAVIVLVCMTLIIFAFKVEEMSRLFVATFGSTYALTAIIAKVGMKSIVGQLQSKGYNVSNVLIIGTGRQAKYLIDHITAQSDLGYKIIGCIDVDKSMVGKDVLGIPILGTVDQLDDLIVQRQIDEVFFAMPVHLVDNVQEFIWSCEEVGIRFSLMTDFIQPSIAMTSVRYFLGIPVLTFSTTPSAVGQLLVKALMDRVLAGLGLLILSPVFLCIAIAIKITSRGPVFFVQKRAGLNGRVFEFFKFRTMVKNAEDLKSELEGLNEMNGPVFKITNDPRVTNIGRFLRKTSVDELPQLINVFLGDMSLVGPRPPIPDEVKKYERWQRRRLSMRPGITCIWQVSGRNEIDFDQWMKLDLKYIDNWSLKLDFVILMKTIPVVLSGRGAS